MSYIRKKKWTEHEATQTLIPCSLKTRQKINVLKSQNNCKNTNEILKELIENRKELEKLIEQISLADIDEKIKEELLS